MKLCAACVGGLNLELSTLSITASLNSPDAYDDSSDGTGTDDEGVLEAAIENAKAQRIVSLLQQPNIYKGLGFKQPPAYTPCPKERFWNSLRLLPLGTYSVSVLQSGTCQATVHQLYYARICRLEMDTVPTCMS